MRSSKGVSLPRHASTDRAPATSAAANVRSHANRPASANAVETWVPLIRRETFLRLQLERRDARARHRIGGRQGRVSDAHFALADQHAREVRERRQIARCAGRSLAGNDRNDSRVEELEQRLDNFIAHAGVPARQRGDLEQDASGAPSASLSGAPVPAECDNTSARCSSASRVASIRVRASSPKPVLTP